jgi:hypothetical protein
MSEVYAIIDGKNQKLADVSYEDSLKVVRGKHVGEYLGEITDMPSGKVFKIYQQSCGIENCNCALSAKEVV